MVTEAGKELLRNTINTAKFHNKLLEENDMWKQWELERGLTMMVSDDDVLKRIRKNHQCAKHRKREKSRERRPIDYCSSSMPGTSKNVSDRWDHSGFKELYPDAIESDKSSSSTESKKHNKKHKKKKRLYRSESSSSDNEILEEFKRYKKSRSKNNKVEMIKTSSSGYDNHVKEWKRQKDKYS